MVNNNKNNNHNNSNSSIFYSSSINDNGTKNNNEMQELLMKIQKVSNDEFKSLYEQIFQLLDESKNKAHESNFKENFIEKLVDLYLQTFSDRVLKILIGISSPLDECLFNILMKKINVQTAVEKRFAVFILISNIVHRSPSWLPNIINMPLLNRFFSILKNDQEIVILAIAALILVELIAALPCLMTKCLDDIFICFSRLSTFLYIGMNEKRQDGPIDKRNLSLLNLNSIVYRVFIRLYAMYPCNFIDYLKHVYGIGCSKENSAVFVQIIQPMLNKICFHPFLITASKERECDKTRWFYKEPHDILIECGQYSIDPIESSHFVEDFAQLYGFLTNDYNNDNDENNEEICDKQPQQAPTYSMQSSNSIFNELKKTIEENGQNLPSLSSMKHGPSVKQFDNKIDHIKKLVNLESAQEAINMGDKMNLSTLEDTKKQTNEKNLFKPVAISANASKTSIMITNNSSHKKNINKKQPCFSPFQPIKEIGNITQTSNNFVAKTIVASSPIDNTFNDQNQRDCNSTIDHESSNDNDDVDIEIIGYNLENGEDKSPMNMVKNQRILTKSDNRNESINSDKSNEIDESSVESVQTKLNDEFVQNVKASFKHLNTRIRYQSNCQQETTTHYNEDDNDFGFPIALLEMKKYSKSCPKLCFENNEDESFEMVKEYHPNSNKGEENIENSIENGERRKSAEKLSQRVHLKLNDSDVKPKQTTVTVVNKTCKSVDFTKEIKSLFFNYGFDKNIYTYSRLLQESRRQLYQSSSSIDFQTPSKLEFDSPHVLLDRTLSTLSEFYLKDSNDRATTSSGDNSDQINRHDSILNTISNTTSIEHIPSMNYSSNSKPNEEDMKKILAIMYAQLVFERHQRNLHVIRNRRLYKKSKDFIQLEEQFKSMKIKMKMLIEEIEAMKYHLNRNSLVFEKERQMYREEIVKIRNDLNRYKNDYEILLNEKTSLELHYRLEIDGLNQNFRTKEVELNKFLCNFDRNVDIMKLEQENIDLKKQMLLFGEFCGKINDVYRHMKLATPEISDKFIYDSLRYENEDLQKRNNELNTKLKYFMEKCQTLENELKKMETLASESNDRRELEYIRDCLTGKEKQIDVLKTLVVNYESHIKKLNGEMIALKLTPNNNRNAVVSNHNI